MLQATIQVRKVADRLALAESLSRDAAGEAARLTELYGTAVDKFIEDIE